MIFPMDEAIRSCVNVEFVQLRIQAQYLLIVGFGQCSDDHILSSSFRYISFSTF